MHAMWYTKVRRQHWTGAAYVVCAADLEVGQRSSYSTIYSNTNSVGKCEERIGSVHFFTKTALKQSNRVINSTLE